MLISKGSSIHVNWDPLEQFEVLLNTCNSDFPQIFGLPTSFFFLYVFFVGLVGSLSFYLALAVAGRALAIKTLVKGVVRFIVSTSRQNLSLTQQGHLPFIFAVFVFIVAANVIGAVPYSLTLTSQILVTLILAILSFTTITLLGVQEHKLQIMNLFLPAGTPIFIAPFLILIEMVSYFSRVLSLSIRLFANMTSGHTLLKILCGFAWTMLCAGSLFTVVSILPAMIIVAVTCLEFAIAFLQAYVFILLFTIYLHDLQGGH